MTHVPATRTQHDGGVTETGDDASLPLAGFTVAVTAARRKEELGALLDRRGARVIYAPAIRIVPLSDDTELVAATREVLADAGRPRRSRPRASGSAAGSRPPTPGTCRWSSTCCRPGCSPAAPRPAARSAAAAWWTPGRRSRSPRPRCSRTCCPAPRARSRGAGSPSSCTATRCPTSSPGCARDRRRGADRAGLPLGAARGRRPGPQARRLDRGRRRSTR